LEKRSFRISNLLIKSLSIFYNINFSFLYDNIMPVFLKNTINEKAVKYFLEPPFIF